jgi:uncharacterized protein (TIGR02452 family)
MSSETRNNRRTVLRKIAEDTLSTLKDGCYTSGNVQYDLKPRINFSKQSTLYYPPDSELSAWASNIPISGSTPMTEISILEISTIDGAHLLSSTNHGKIGILNFASAKKPGGGFISGAQAQEESIARSSTLYPTLMTAPGQRFYTLHNRDSKGCYYSHAMIYSPRIVFFRDDNGSWTEPIEADVLTSPAVNAGVVRKTLHGRVAGKAVEVKIEEVMRERMARILFLFERQGIKDVVLGSFGTGVFRNDIGLVARIWADLLAVGDARFKHTFDRIVFAVLGTSTFDKFKDAFDHRMKKDDHPPG